MYLQSFMSLRSIIERYTHNYSLHWHKWDNNYCTELYKLFYRFHFPRISITVKTNTKFQVPLFSITFPHRSSYSLTIVPFLRVPQIYELPSIYTICLLLISFPLTHLPFIYPPLLTCIYSYKPENRLRHTVLLIYPIINTSKCISVIKVNFK